MRHVLDMTEDDEQELQRESLPGVGSAAPPRQPPAPRQPAPPAPAPPQAAAPFARSAVPPEDMYDTEIAALEAQLNSVPGIQRQVITREISQLQQLQAKAAATATTPQTPTAAAAPAGTPLPVGYVLATGEPFKTKDGQLMELVTVAFTPNPSDPYFAGVDIWFSGYHGSPTPQLVASGSTSPVSFLAEITGETVTFTVQSYGSTGLVSDIAAAPSATIALDGVPGAPPQPTVTQLLAQTPVGYQFEFSQEAGLAADVVAGYNVYRAASNSFGAAVKVDHLKQDPTNSGTVVWQDAQAAGVTMYYWVTAVNTSGLESAPTACQSGTVVSGSGLNSAGQLVTGTPSTPAAQLDSGAARANTAIDAGNVVAAAAIDLSRAYTNKNLDNVPPGSTYTALPIAATSGSGTGTKVNLAGAAGVAGQLPTANHDPTVVAGAGKANSGLDSSGRLTAGTPSTSTADLDTGASRAINAIDSGNVVVASGIDMARGYTGKHLGNVPDDSGSGRYAAVEASADKTINHAVVYQALGSTSSPSIPFNTPAVVPEMSLVVTSNTASGTAQVVFTGNLATTNANGNGAGVNIYVYVDGAQQAASRLGCTSAVNSQSITIGASNAPGSFCSVTANAAATVTLNYSISGLSAGTHTVEIWAAATSGAMEWQFAQRSLQVVVFS